MSQNLIGTTSITPQILYSGQLSATTDTTLYTGAASTSTIVKYSAICNTSAGGGTSSSLLSTGSAITSIPINALMTPMPSGSTFTISSGANSQTWTLNAAAAVGATSLTVTSQTPNFAYPIGSAITFAGVTAHVTLRVVPSGGSADATHTALSYYALTPGQSIEGLLVGLDLGPSDAIHAQTDQASIVDLIFTGSVNT